jgi:hypothetical protein
MPHYQTLWLATLPNTTTLPKTLYGMQRYKALCHATLQVPMACHDTEPYGVPRYKTLSDAKLLRTRRHLSQSTLKWFVSSSATAPANLQHLQLDVASDDNPGGTFAVDKINIPHKILKILTSK